MGAVGAVLSRIMSPSCVDNGAPAAVVTWALTDALPETVW
jgi:hypothetical protein